MPKAQAQYREQLQRQHQVRQQEQQSKHQEQQSKQQEEQSKQQQEQSKQQQHQLRRQQQRALGSHPPSAPFASRPVSPSSQQEQQAPASDQTVTARICSTSTSATNPRTSRRWSLIAPQIGIPFSGGPHAALFGPFMTPAELLEEEKRRKREGTGCTGEGISGDTGMSGKGVGVRREDVLGKGDAVISRGFDLESGFAASSGSAQTGPAPAGSTSADPVTAGLSSISVLASVVASKSASRSRSCSNSRSRSRSRSRSLSDAGSSPAEREQEAAPPSYVTSTDSTAASSNTDVVITITADTTITVTPTGEESSSSSDTANDSDSASNLRSTNSPQTSLETLEWVHSKSQECITEIHNLDIKISFCRRLIAEGNGYLNERIEGDLTRWEEARTAVLESWIVFDRVRTRIEEALQKARYEGRFDEGGVRAGVERRRASVSLPGGVGSSLNAGAVGGGTATGEVGESSVSVSRGEVTSGTSVSREVKEE